MIRRGGLLLLLLVATCAPAMESRCDRIEPNHSGVLECHLDGPYTGPVLVDTTGGRDIDLDELRGPR